MTGARSTVLPRMKAAQDNSDVPLHIPAPHRDIAEPAHIRFGAANYGIGAGFWGNRCQFPGFPAESAATHTAVEQGSLDGEVSAFTKVSSLAEQYEPTDDEQDT
eukprot:COSAG05_NODE_8370_length_709_cov_1.455738_1_plen_103_part_01